VIPHKPLKLIYLRFRRGFERTTFPIVDYDRHPQLRSTFVYSCAFPSRCLTRSGLRQFAFICPAALFRCAFPFRRDPRRPSAAGRSRPFAVDSHRSARDPAAPLCSLCPPRDFRGPALLFGRRSDSAPFHGGSLAIAPAPMQDCGVRGLRPSPRGSPGRARSLGCALRGLPHPLQPAIGPRWWPPARKLQRNPCRFSRLEKESQSNLNGL
jgi:hypothetical protein